MRRGVQPRSPLGDAVYALKALAVTPGADRAPVVLGDAPAHPTTRGGTWLGTTVPPDLTPDAVFAAVAPTLGRSTDLIPIILQTSKEQPSLEGSVELMFRGIQFSTPGDQEARGHRLRPSRARRSSHGPADEPAQPV